MRDLPTHILLIDDEVDFLELAEEILAGAGFHVTAVGSAMQAVQKVRGGFCPDGILLDYRMPDMTGPQALQAIRDAGCTAPAALVSAMANLEETATASGFFGFLGKPFTVDAFIGLATSLVNEATARGAQ